MKTPLFLCATRQAGWVAIVAAAAASAAAAAPQDQAGPQREAGAPGLAAAHSWSATCSHLTAQGGFMFCVLDSEPNHYFWTRSGVSYGGALTTYGVFSSDRTLEELRGLGTRQTEVWKHNGRMRLIFGHGLATYEGIGQAWPSGGGGFTEGAFD